MNIYNLQHQNEIYMKLSTVFLFWFYLYTNYIRFFYYSSITIKHIVMVGVISDVCPFDAPKYILHHPIDFDNLVSSVA